MPFADPDRARDYQREYRRTRRAGDDCTTPGTTLVPLTFRLQTAQDVIDLLQEQIEAVRTEQEASTLEKARAIGHLGGGAVPGAARTWAERGQAKRARERGPGRNAGGKSWRCWPTESRLKRTAGSSFAPN